MQRLPRYFAIAFLLFTAFNLSFTLFSPPPTASNQIGVVSADKMNILYIGADNPISVAMADVPIEQTKVSISEGKGTLSQTAKIGIYNVDVNSPGSITIRAEGVTNQGKTVMKELGFRVKRIPDPIPKLGGKTGGRLSIDTLKALKELTVELEDFDYDGTFQLLEFEFTLAYYQHLYISNNEGSTFNERTQNLIQKAEVENVIYLDNIRVKGPDGITRKLPTASFILY
ncbi:MAG: GldM family protein [Chitinophagales bacterium]